MLNLFSQYASSGLTLGGSIDFASAWRHWLAYARRKLQRQNSTSYSHYLAGGGKFLSRFRSSTLRKDARSALSKPQPIRRMWLAIVSQHFKACKCSQQSLLHLDNAAPQG